MWDWRETVKVTRSKIEIASCVLMWMLFLGTSAIFFVCPGVYLFSKLGIFVPLYQGVLTLLVVLNFASVIFMDPGIIPKQSSDERT